MPDKYGINFDGWPNCSEHYLAVFATNEVDGLVKTSLLSMAPNVNEPDDNLKAESHHSALESVLAVFGKELVHYLFLVGDDCSVNKKLGPPHEPRSVKLLILFCFTHPPPLWSPLLRECVVKLQRGRPLGCQEKAAVSVLKVASGGPSADNPDDGFAERVLKRARVSEQTDKYILVAAILPTSNIVERLFSMARTMIGLERHSLQPIMVEAMLFLKVNISYWDVNVVHDVLETE
ncbi:hypothetical protein GQ600_15507 [Phytophthora cactorum]|nr:hypothetical protein GQ600_15507 [Phytophthora cactorum]